MSRVAFSIAALCTIGTAVLPISSAGRGHNRSTHQAWLVDTVRVSHDALAQALDNPSACQSPGKSAGVWSRAPKVVQAGEFAFVAGGEIVMLDEKESRMYAYSADGQDLGHFGSRGAGPGEFQGNAHLVPWAGDTVAVYAGDQFHVVLFKGHRYERTLGLPRSLGPGSTIAGGRMSGENGVVFGSLDPVDYVPKETEIIRPTFSLVLWQPGSSVVIPVRREIPASEFTVWTIGGGWGNGRRLTVFGRKTFIGVLRDQVALLDNATQAVELIEMSGHVRRVIKLDIPDVRVTAADRDSVAQENKAILERDNTYRAWVDELPQTRSSISQLSADDADGFWITVLPPAAQGTAVHIRFTAAGQPDRCIRIGGNARIVAYSVDRVVTVTELDDGDVINVARTIPLRRQR